MQTVRGSKINNRKFPGIKGKRPDKKAHRQYVAAENKLHFASLNMTEKLNKTSPNSKERNRLLKLWGQG